MSKIEKLIKRFLSIPTDFTYNGLVKLLAHFRYDEETGKTTGSSVEFVNYDTDKKIKIHKPHPQPFLKEYAIKQIINKLKDHGVIE